MSRSRNPLPEYTHPLFRVQIEEWGRRAGLDSARPDAPVVTELSRGERLMRWWRTARWRRPGLQAAPAAATCYRVASSTSR
ncbi:hypothetical protein ACQEVB_31510 [Pseudonocardia sp. CA-107938]|uniref:hypothetical protein n=1 Tax=Pseudonocardia sp. CA-107938 TaxID=3240021 RepID=UPI003D926D39